MEIINGYGPTENTICSTFYKVSHKKETSSRYAPIGRPMNNTHVYILDSYLNSVPIGVAGEMYIGGTGVARGYINRPDLTAERFIPNPFISLEDSQKGKNLKLYKTGDLARYLPDGNIEFLGRVDDQVKIRGFRIELEEISSVLKEHKTVHEAVVVTRKNDLEENYLLAYIVPNEKYSHPELEENSSPLNQNNFLELQGNLRSYLERVLPDYMIPSFFVFLDKLPLTPTGKIDKKALPSPNLSLRQVSETYIAPSTPIEERLSSIWTEILRIEKIGIHDNFFKLGGHSLLATQVISRIRNEYNIDLPLQALFEHPTIKNLSEDIQEFINNQNISQIPPIVPQQRPQTLPLSFAQQRLWFLDQLIPDSALYNVPLALKLSGPLNLDALEKAFNDLIQRHESLRTIFPTTQGEANQVILPHNFISISQALDDLSNLSPEEQLKSINI
ncbi:MAG: non-ribosomal peptide synthetase, partial [Alphaproteobacteria bacterium]|nr:non-ribosomal peptide synthetase [Alphaproteobacteria bacterium]